MYGIGNKIKERREQLGWTQEELAFKMGYKSTSTIAKIESGKNDVTQKNIIKFANVLNVSIEYLMDWNSKEIENRTYEFDDNGPMSGTLISINEELSKMDEKKLIQLLAFAKIMNGGENNDN